MPRLSMILTEAHLINIEDWITYFETQSKRVENFEFRIIGGDSEVEIKRNVQKFNQFLSSKKVHFEVTTASMYDPSAGMFSG